MPKFDQLPTYHCPACGSDETQVRDSVTHVYPAKLHPDTGEIFQRGFDGDDELTDHVDWISDLVDMVSVLCVACGHELDL